VEAAAACSHDDVGVDAKAGGNVGRLMSSPCGRAWPSSPPTVTSVGITGRQDRLELVVLVVLAQGSALKRKEPLGIDDGAGVQTLGH
jgi:hypothetical protein